MGKHDRTSPDQNSVDELLSTIRQAIEADTADLDGQPKNGTVRPLRAPRAPRVGTIRPATPQQEVMPPQAQLTPPVATEGDDQPRPGYHSSNPYRYRHSLETSPSYMSLRNRLASLKSRTRSSTNRSMASLLGGDVRQEEARARDQQQQLLPQYTAEQQANADPHSGLKASIDADQAPSDDVIAADVSSGVVSYTPDYSDWSLESPLSGVVPPDDDLEQQEASQPLVTSATVSVDTTTDSASETEQADKADEPDATESSGEGVTAATLSLEKMVRQVLEPEMAGWIDEHLPDQVAAAMPDEEAFTAMIKPMIEAWLAEHLSPIVEAAVREEIARITGLKR